MWPNACLSQGAASRFIRCGGAPEGLGKCQPVAGRALFGLVCCLVELVRPGPSLANLDPPLGCRNMGAKLFPTS